MRINQFDPYFTDAEVKLVTAVLKSKWVTEGRYTARFQEMLQDYCKVKYALLLPNGTLALYVALKIIGIGPGDEVVVPAFTFVASATSVVLTGARPVFADVRKDDFNLDIDGLKSCLSKRTKAIMPVHIYGQAARMDEIMAIAAKYRLKVVEDAAQGLGVTFGQKHVGTFGDIGCMSFYADKTITTAEGGVILTNSKDLAQRCMYFKNQGRLKRGSFIHPYLGYNFRFTDLQAALGIAQMEKLGFIIKKKKQNELWYKEFLKGEENVVFPEIRGYGRRVPFRVNIMVPNPEQLGAYSTGHGIGVRRFFYPLDKQPCFNQANSRRPAPCKNAQYIFNHGLSLPSGVALAKRDIEYVCLEIKKYYRKR